MGCSPSPAVPGEAGAALLGQDGSGLQPAQLLHLLVPSQEGLEGAAGDQMAAAHAGEFLRAALWPLTPVLLSQLLWRRGSSWFNTAHWF